MSRREGGSPNSLHIDIESPLGLIAGNGEFPLLVLDEARRRGINVATVAIRGEADVRVGERSDTVEWVALGEMSRCLRFFKRSGVRNAIMAGQVKHQSVFRSLKPDPGLARVLLKMRRRNTDAILGAVADVLAAEGIHLLDSTSLLRPLLATPGVMGRLKPNADQKKDVEYGIDVARELARQDIGQSVVVKGGAVVAVEAMEGTDETIRRAARIVRGGLTVAKAARPRQDMRFDVPVVGPRTIDVMAESGCAVLAVQAGKSLLLEKPSLIDKADAGGIVVFGAT